MTIHSEHPFLEPESGRNPLRRFRGRMPLPVSVWTHGQDRARVGWTVSSLLVADGEPAEALALLDEDSALADALEVGGPVVANLLAPGQQQLADVFAGQAPAPGGAFRSGRWRDSDWGPVLVEATAWLGLRVLDLDQRAGWSQLLRCVVEQVELGESADPVLGYLGGRYHAWSR